MLIKILIVLCGGIICMLNSCKVAYNDIDENVDIDCKYIKGLREIDADSNCCLLPEFSSGGFLFCPVHCFGVNTWREKRKSYIIDVDTIMIVDNGTISAVYGLWENKKIVIYECERVQDSIQDSNIPLIFVDDCWYKKGQEEPFTGSIAVPYAVLKETDVLKHPSHIVFQQGVVWKITEFDTEGNGTITFDMDIFINDYNTHGSIICFYERFPAVIIDMPFLKFIEMTKPIPQYDCALLPSRIVPYWNFPYISNRQ